MFIFLNHVQCTPNKCLTVYSRRASLDSLYTW